MEQSFAATLQGVGPRLKRLRERENTTLAQLAAVTGISLSTLSRLESGLRRPTLEQLLPLARFYGLTLDALVNAPRSADPRVDLRPVSAWDGAVIIPLTQRPGGIQAYKFVLPARADETVPRLQSHAGYEWAYVLNGKLRIVLGDRDFVMRAGEAAEFETTTPHWFGATSTGPVEFLSLFGRQGQRAHIHSV
ncbi:MAG TPA: XRE family transcriptional regulator [Enteractinococcus sp.]